MTHTTILALTTILLLPGCLPTSEGNSLVVATAWPPNVREELQASFLLEAGDPTPITWINLAPGESSGLAVDRRGGVDVLLGGLIEEHDALALAGRSVAIHPERGITWEVARRPDAGSDSRRSLDLLDSLGSFTDPRDDPTSLTLARRVLEETGWAKGYEALVRHAAGSRLQLARPARIGPVEKASPRSTPQPEGISLARGGRDSRRARQFVEFLEGRGLAGEASRMEVEGSKADGLLADLLGAAMVDALEELRQAQAALVRFGHPAAAEAAMGQRPPWPPASVAKLRLDPGGESLVETLLEQIAPDPEGRASLLESWSRPKRSIDGTLLAELATAADGRLAREPRFRAWLRSEWTAWTRQLYRRVARVAGGYVPS